MAAKFLFFLIPVGLYLTVWTSYTFFLTVPFNEKRLSEGILLLIAAGMICISRSLQDNWIHIFESLKSKSKVVVYALIGLPFLGLISAALSNYPAYAYLEISHLYLLFNLMMLCIIAYLYNPSYFEYGFLSIVGLLAGLYLINVTISYIYSFFIPDFPLWPSTDFIRIKFSDIGFRYPEPFSNFINVRFFNQLQTWSLPLLTLLVIHIPKRYWAFSKIAFLIACGWWMLVFAADARGTTLASFLALGFVFYMYRTKARKWLRVHSLSAIIGFISYGLFFKLLPLLVNTTSSRTAFAEYGDSGRLEIWNSILNLILQNPVFGVGPLHFGQWGSTISKAPHNIYLQFLVEWGLLAGIVFIALVIMGSYYWLTSSNKIIENSAANSPKVNIRVTLTASLLAALLHGFVSNIFNSPLSQVMMILVLGWMIGSSLPDGKEEKLKPVNPYFRYGLIGINLLAAGFLIWSFATQLPRLDENRLQYLEKSQIKRLYPRYWDQGVIGLNGNDNKQELE